MSIKDNIEMRVAIETVIGFCEDEAKEFGQGFWEMLEEGLCKYLPRPIIKENPVRKFTDAESRVFGRTRIPFGEFSGELVDSVSLTRLIWYGDQTFIDNLRRYLASDRIQNEM